jgi:porphobilinogen synthase
VALDGLVMPLFVRPGRNVHRPITSMPGQTQWSAELVVEQCCEIHSLGIPAVMLFGIIDKKDALGSAAWDAQGIVQQTVRQIKKACPELIVITDVCLCEYTDHGHCGRLAKFRGETIIDNDGTLELLAKVAVSHAHAGADIVAPSDMMDGRVGVIRTALDHAGYSLIPIMSYAAKFASGFYGPFRDAAESPPKFGDRRTYQMDFYNSDEAMHEIAADLDEGADIVIVKPALAYLDIVYRAKTEFGVPIACYNVSGEYAALKAAAQNGWLNERDTVMETFVAMRRAGADIVISYFAKDIAEWLADTPRPSKPTFAAAKTRALRRAKKR